MKTSHPQTQRNSVGNFLGLFLCVEWLLASAGCTSPSTSPRSSTFASPPTALDRYITAPDPSYHYELLKTIQSEGLKTYVISMTSQTWLTTNEVDRPVWNHWIMLTIPNDVTNTTALLLISGGSNGKTPPESADSKTLLLAKATKSAIAELRMVPNQPVIFGNDGKKRTEDSLIAYTWDKFLRTGDEKWPARLPMTKAAVRAMDTVISFCATNGSTGAPRVQNFFVAGGSKRGWTTWTTAAVDRRVRAIAPLVIDVLNIEPSFIHHWEAYGFYAPAVQDYVEAGIMDWQGTPQYRKLMQIEEPYEYRDRLTMPKFIVNACGDQFFLPDSSQYYFKDLLGTKYLRYVPNTDHSLKNSDAIESLAVYFDAVVRNVPLPRFSWTEDPGTHALRVRTVDRPSSVKLWQATNPNARDFRLMTIGSAWTHTDLADEGGGVYVGQVSKPNSGWTAFMVELTYDSPGGPAPFKFTTQVNVVPDVIPHKFVHPTPPTPSTPSAH